MMERSLRAKQARGWAVAAMGSMLIYFVVVNHVDLYPWNNLVSPQLPSTLAGVVPFAVYALAFATGTRWLMLLGVVHSYIWLLLQVRQWWIPYLLGPTPIHKDFAWYTEHGYSETIKFLPAIAEPAYSGRGTYSPASAVAAGGGGYNLGLCADSQRDEHSWRRVICPADKTLNQ